MYKNRLKKGYLYKPIQLPKMIVAPPAAQVKAVIIKEEKIHLKPRLHL